MKSRTRQITELSTRLCCTIRQDVLKEKQRVRLKVESSARLSASKNHSVTHLLNEALRKVLGAHVSQQGSYVGDEVLRFDFNHYSRRIAKQCLRSRIW